MKGLTPEQKTAQEALQKAIVEHCLVFRPVTETDPQMVSDWIVVANIIWFDSDGERMSAYNIGFSDGQMDEHKAVGLCEIGKRVASGEMEME